MTSFGADFTHPNSQTLSDNHHQVVELVNLVLALDIVLRNHAALNEARVGVRSTNGRVEGLSANIVVVDVDSLGCKALERLGVGLVLVVEGLVEGELVLDKVNLGI